MKASWIRGVLVVIERNVVAGNVAAICTCHEHASARLVIAVQKNGVEDRLIVAGDSLPDSLECSSWGPFVDTQNRGCVNFHLIQFNIFSIKLPVNILVDDY